MLISLIGETHAHTHTQCQSQRGASAGQLTVKRVDHDDALLTPWSGS